MASEKIQELTNLINDTKESVDKSAFGPIFMYPDERDILNKQVNQLAWTLFLHLITPIMKEYVAIEKEE